ncbi:carboxymuconolactone decarboxylase family protein [Roseinatronobacter alkalisoli]|uniref:Peroxidase-related enzyme n=1 Tax=Roseinatronobacter alkalisoli TaxID=3028235 RepID=A0ABT5T3F1_9RHOB|nr:hypothetical protein [Roseinatronobacter sp. HJB301]MDD7969645.1 hypothetical protein [Roseinatronobacter sp. HJB301]
MSHFPDIHDLDLHARFSRFHQRGILPLQEYHDAVLREDSELTIAEHKLIAVYVPSVNGCHCCFSAHRDHARAGGIDEGVFGDVEIHLDHDDIPARMRPVLAFARKLTREPSATSMTDAQAVYDAGFFEEGLFDILSVTALYNFMNRILEGAGSKRHKTQLQMTDEMRRKFRYKNLWQIFTRQATRDGQ